MLIFLISFLILHFSSASLLPKQVAEWVLKEFEHYENLSKPPERGLDRRPSFPFITGDGFRYIADQICEDHNRCRMDPEGVKNNEIIFVKTDFFEFFSTYVTTRINSSYIIISHNGDLSAPDGQSDAPRIGLPQYHTSNILQSEFNKKKLIAHHGQNLWWVNNTLSPRPLFSHCLPIGFENRQYPIGKQVAIYTKALNNFVINRDPIPDDKRPLLLIAFYPKSRVPDRHKVLSILQAIPVKNTPKMENPFYNYTDLNHYEWLEAITYHKFVLAPFGHGLDTNCISEIFMMGGIPVMRRSTISSCYDDSDNSYNGVNRGSLPVVIVDKWEDITKERLEKEWIRIKNEPTNTWDWNRLFIYHWIERIAGKDFLLKKLNKSNYKIPI